MTSILIVFCMCICSVYAPEIERDALSPAIVMAIGILVFMVERSVYLPFETMGAVSQNISRTDRIRATCAIVIPQYIIYCTLIAYLIRFAILARTRKFASHVE